MRLNYYLNEQISINMKHIQTYVYYTHIQLLSE